RTADAEGKSLNRQTSPASNAELEVAVRYDDVELVKRLQAGDQSAFRVLFDRYNRRVFAVAFGVLKNPQDALDVVQEAFIKVHNLIGGFQGTSSFYTWLYRIAMNLAIDHVRRGRKIVEFDDSIKKEDAAGDGALLPRLIHENPGKTAIQKELSQRIEAALAELP